MDAEQRRQVASQIRQARKQQRYTQKQLAEKADVSLRMITDLETGQRLPQDGTLSRIIDALDMPRPDDIRETWPPEVRVFLDMIGAWLSARPEAERLSIIRAWTRRLVGGDW
jgi:transcriptional regulator with XRE-family HTH domain